MDIGLFSPMILASKGQRLSKRHGATGVEEYKNMGYFPESILNYLFLLGWSPTDEKEIFNLNEMINQFNFDGIVKKGAIFDIKKLEWVSGQHLTNKSPKFANCFAKVVSFFSSAS